MPSINNLFNLDWQTTWNFITAISTLAMAIIAGLAMNTWKSQQRRQKLINLLETLNKYIQDLQYYEIESTIFSKQARNDNQENFNNNEIIERQDKLIDIELAEGFGNCVLSFKNWTIEYDKHYDALNDINKKLQEYRLKIFIYVELKIKFYIEKNKPENMLYADNNKALFYQIENTKLELEKSREILIKSINKFKDQNKKIL